MGENVVFVAVMPPLTVACLSVSTWSTWKVFLSSMEVLKQLKQRPHSPSMSDRSSRNAVSLKWTVYLNIATGMFFWMTLLWTLIWVVLFSVHVFSHSIWSDYLKIHRKRNVWIISTLSRLCQLVACVLLLIVSMQRGRMAFENTKYRMSFQSIVALKCSIMVCLICGITSFATFYFHLQSSLALAFVALVSYIVTSMVITLRFFFDSSAIAKRMRMDRDDNDGVRSMSGLNESGDSQVCSQSSDLLDVALRLSILSVTSSVSTLVSITLYIAAYGTRSTVIRYLALVSFPLDTSLNGIALLCFMVKHVNVYELVFGWLHHRIKLLL